MHDFNLESSALLYSLYWFKLYSEPRGGSELKENFMLRSDDIMLSSWMVRLFSQEYLSILVHSKKEQK